MSVRWDSLHLDSLSWDGIMGVFTVHKGWIGRITSLGIEGDPGLWLGGAELLFPPWEETSSTGAPGTETSLFWDMGMHRSWSFWLMWELPWSLAGWVWGGSLVGFLEWNKSPSTMSQWSQPLWVLGLRLVVRVGRPASFSVSTAGWQRQGLGENVAPTGSKITPRLSLASCSYLLINIYYFGEKKFPCMSYSIFWEENFAEEGIYHSTVCWLSLFIYPWLKIVSQQGVVRWQGQACTCAMGETGDRLWLLQWCHCPAVGGTDTRSLPDQVPTPLAGLWGPGKVTSCLSLRFSLCRMKDWRCDPRCGFHLSWLYSLSSTNLRLLGYLMLAKWKSHKTQKS